MNRVEGFPNSTTAATWSATSAGIGVGTSAAATPSGTSFAVTKPMTAAPWENPASTSFVSGQVATVAMTCARASAMPWTAVENSSVAG